METNIVNVKIPEGVSQGLDNQILMRVTPLENWLKTTLSNRLSGTLKKNASIGFKYKTQLLHEAVCQTMGWGFEVEKTTYITYNVPMTEGDVKSLTELGWFVDRLLHIHPFDEDKFELKYINIQNENGDILRQGVGVIVSETSIQWIPKGTILFSLISEYDSKNKIWLDAVNPF
jgi:hypothetical protein